MLGRIIKYDLRDSFRQSYALLIGAFILSVLCFGFLYFSLCLSNGIVIFTLIALFFLSLLCMLAALTVAALCAPLRYYRSLFTDEGYLTMVIPVRTSTLLNAKILSVLIYEAAMLAAFFLGFVVSCALPIYLDNPEYIVDFFRFLGNIFIGNFASSDVIALLYIVNALLKIFAQTIILLGSITQGALVVRRHKMLGAIAFFFAINAALGVFDIITSWIIEGVVTGELLARALPLVIGIISNLSVAAVLYFVNRRIMTKKFNIL